jgi:hypothetical protein
MRTKAKRGYALVVALLFFEGEMQGQLFGFEVEYRADLT